MRPPAFWQHGTASPFALLLSPIGVLAARATARRVAGAGWAAPVPVLCVGNASVGGAGKTTVALDLGRRLRDRGRGVAFLTRGYGGRTRSVRRVAPGDDAADVGDEALLLAAVAATYVAADRAAGARAALAGGAGILVMDDGLQNPTLRKTASLLVIDGAAGFGNGRLLPAGPLREPVAAAAARVQAAVLIGADETGALARLPRGLPVLRADLRSELALAPGTPLAAFAGIGRPEKFFASLEAAGGRLVLRRGFPDHHRYTAPEIAGILDAARRAGAVAVTTPKDAVRLPPASAADVIPVGVALDWHDPAGIDALLDRLLRA